MWRCHSEAHIPNILETAKISICKIDEVGCWLDGMWVWNIANFINSDYNSTTIDCIEIDAIMMNIYPNRDLTDSFVWWGEAQGVSIRLTYQTLADIQNVIPPLEDNKAKKFRILWSFNILSNIQTFAMR